MGSLNENNTYNATALGWGGEVEKCKAKYYTNNSVVTHSPLVCFGGFGQPECKYLNECLNEYGFKVHITKSGKRRIKKLKIN